MLTSPTHQQTSSDMRPIRDVEHGLSVLKSNPLHSISRVACVEKEIGIEDQGKVIHSIKVGIALVLVSLLYLIQPLYGRVGDNAMGAIMTVGVVFEFTAGATLSKALNRGMGTILGGGLGCLAALLAQQAGGLGRAIVISISVFISGAAATYSRLIPTIKRNYDHGAMIFILTFNLVAVSSFRGEGITKLAREQLLPIIMGLPICVFTSLFVFPIWASNALHHSVVSKFDYLALSIEECFKEFPKMIEEKPEAQASTSFNYYKSVLNSKAADEELDNFARWEPWHGKFGFSYPWKKYLRIGELLREMAASVLTIRECLQTYQQSPPCLKLIAKEPCEAMGSQICSTLRELGDSIFSMTKFCEREVTVEKLHSSRLELQSVVSAFLLETLAIENRSISDGYPSASFVFLLMEMVYKVEALVKEVEELADLAGFHSP